METNARLSLDIEAGRLFNGEGEAVMRVPVCVAQIGVAETDDYKPGLHVRPRRRPYICSNLWKEARDHRGDCQGTICEC